MKKYLILLLLLLTACDFDTAVNTTEEVIDDIEEQINPQELIEPGEELTIRIIDVGQGDAQLITYPNGKHILIDCGDNYNADELIQYLDHLEITEIEYLIITHPDADHIGGADEIFEEYKIINTWDNGESKATVAYRNYDENKEGNYVNIGSDTSLDIDPTVKTTVIVPYEEGKFSNTNDNSISLLISYGDIKYLSTGDCEEHCEAAILNDVTDVNLMKIGHHGSKTSTSPEFLGRVLPEEVIISVGADNRYGHPHQETLDKLKEKSILVYKTSSHGTITIKTDGDDYTIRRGK